MKIRKEAALFALGGCGYVGLELLWRGRSHGSMFAAGGACFLLLGKLGEYPLSLPVRAAAGSGVITAVELGTGLLVNREHAVPEDFYPANLVTIEEFAPQGLLLYKIKGVKGVKGTLLVRMQIVE